jgi:type II secretory pathway pseudopilin PulG
MAAIMPIGENKTSQNGYTFLALLILLIIIGYSLGEAGAMWSDATRREREQELLKVGNKFRTAIGQYYNASPGAVKQYPPNLEALLRDDRFPVPNRYLRKIYTDPITASSNWGTQRSPSGGIMGVCSLSIRTPFKTKQFRPINHTFEGKKMYAQWMFTYSPEQ